MKYWVKIDCELGRTARDGRRLPTNVAACFGARRSLETLGDGLQEIHFVQREGNISVSPELLAERFVVGFQVMARHEYDREIGSGSVGAQLAADLEAIHPFHPNIEEYEIRKLASCERKRFFAARCLQNVITGFTQDARGHLAQSRLVVHIQDTFHLILVEWSAPVAEHAKDVNTPVGYCLAKDRESILIDEIEVSTASDEMIGEVIPSE